MALGLEIRQFLRRDAEQVWRLHNDALADVGAHLGNGPWDDDLHSIEATYLETGGEFLVGMLAGELVAMGALRPNVGFAEVKRMRVDPHHQRRGFGGEVLERLEQRAGELGYDRLRLDTTTNQIGAQALYRSHGWELTGKQIRVGQFDVVFFEKYLGGRDQ